MTPPIVIAPQAPPADMMSSAKPAAAPNWLLKTAMAATGTALAVMLVIRLVVNVWFLTGMANYDVVTTRIAKVFTPYVPAGTWLWIIRVVALLLIAAHVAIGVVLVLRAASHAGVHTKLHGGWHAWLTRLMPYTGGIVLLFSVFYVLDQVFHVVVAPWTDIDPGFSPNVDPAFGNSSMQLVNSLSHPWIAACYIIGLLAIAAHVLHGLGTVITIAAGGGQWASQMKRWLVWIGGAVVGALLLASLFIPIGVLGGWLR